MIEIKQISKRRLNYHDVISSRTEFMNSNARHAGFFYARMFNIPKDVEIEYLSSESGAINYILENYVIRDIEDILEDHKNNYKIVWIDTKPNERCFGNITIKEIDCNDYRVYVNTSFSDKTTLIEEYESEYIEDVYLFALNNILEGFRIMGEENVNIGETT